MQNKIINSDDTSADFNEDDLIESNEDEEVEDEKEDEYEEEEEEEDDDDDDYDMPAGPTESEHKSIVQFCRAREVSAEIEKKGKEERSRLTAIAKAQRLTLKEYLHNQKKTCILIQSQMVQAIDKNGIPIVDKKTGELKQKEERVYIRLKVQRDVKPPNKEDLGEAIKAINDGEVLLEAYQQILARKLKEEKIKKESSSKKPVIVEKSAPKKIKEKIIDPTLINVLVEALTETSKKICLTQRDIIEVTNAAERAPPAPKNTKKVKPLTKKEKDKIKTEELENIVKLPENILVEAKGLMKTTAELKKNRMKIVKGRTRISESLGIIGEDGSHLNNISQYLRRIKPDKLSTKIMLGMDEDGIPLEMYLRQKQKPNPGAFTFSHLPGLLKKTLGTMFAKYEINIKTQFTQETVLNCLSPDFINETYTLLLHEISKHKKENANPISRITLDKCKRTRKRAQTQLMETDNESISEARDIQPINNKNKRNRDDGDDDDNSIDSERPVSKRNRQ